MNGPVRGHQAPLLCKRRILAWLRLVSSALVIAIVPGLKPLPAIAASSEFTAPAADVALRKPIAPTYKLTTSVDVALKNFPTLRYAHAKVRSTSAGITLERTAYLPTIDTLIQELRTTQNVLAGSIFPQTLNVIPMQTGPASHSSTFNSIFASNTGFNLSWEVYDWGLRKSNVVLARARHGQASAQVGLTELDVAAAAAEKYLATVSARETIRANKATVERMQAWNLVTHTLVDKGLRPGVDASRADADLAFAKIALIESERESDLARVDLAESMGLAGTYIAVEDAPWIKRPEKLFRAEAVQIDTHPLAVVRAAQVKTAHAQVTVYDKAWRPHLWFHSGIWGRGSGAPNETHPVAGGVVPQVGNWVAGFSMSFPVLSYYPIKAQKRMAMHEEQAQRANYDLAIQVLTQNDDRARILLDNARRIADETPLLIQAARDNEVKALERYRVGLCNVVEVAEAERILERALVEDAVAQVRVWRSILATAYAQGNLKPFMVLARTAEGGK